jgi:hypothetical protein
MPTPYELDARFDYEIESWISRARDAKEPRAALGVLARFVNAVEAKEVLDTRMLRYLSESFREMLDAGTNDPRKMLGLQRGKAGNPGGMSEKRVLSPDMAEELRKKVWEMFGDGKTQGAIEKELSRFEIVPARPAQCVSRDTIRNMVRELKQVYVRRDELQSTGMVGYEITRRLARELDIEERIVGLVLSRRMEDSSAE